ncbi:ABC transporter ATP-binding protein [Halorubrum lipolyticum]|uniref:Nickel import system ATP-binding protein NikD n=1 Tax=Halorubrum lipolyticum DSM 21995 TaxID=1227482 RepID=M0NP04_9EURY|nr:oligopeptide/dipeptide ABC transporter ATPase [Halorubrum lipolyticum DSM 21995]
MKSEPIAEVENLNVAFPMDRGESRVVRDADIDIYQDEILGVVGESGSGKSMFAASLLDGVVEPGVSRGEITFNPPDGGDPISVLDLTEEELRRFRWDRVAMVFQGAMSSFNPVKTIGAHFKETLQDHNKNVEEGLERGRQLLEDLYLDPDRVMDSYPHELSGGMKQRGLIALSLLLDPDLLILDEPTAALDLLMQRSIISLLREVQTNYDATFVMITHDLALLSKLADRMVIMYAFQFIEMGETDEIIWNASHPYTRALLASTPSLASDIDEMKPIPGDKPDPVEQFHGCSYSSRCPLADERCREEEPPLRAVEGSTTQQTACFHYEDAAEAIHLPSSPQEAAESAAADGEGQ